MVIRRNAAEFLAQLLRSMRLTLARDTRKANSFCYSALLRQSDSAKRDVLHRRTLYRGEIASLRRSNLSKRTVGVLQAGDLFDVQTRVDVRFLGSIWTAIHLRAVYL